VGDFLCALAGRPDWLDWLGWLERGLSAVGCGADWVGRWLFEFVFWFWFWFWFELLGWLFVSVVGGDCLDAGA
jgi:hypothetical protein